MNRTAPGLACACLCLSSSLALGQAVRPAAPPSVTVYGLVDEGVEIINGRNDGAGGTTTSVRVGSGTAASRFGIRGNTGDMMPTLKGLFALEAGISADLGTLGQGGRIFGRQAFVGLQGGWGTVSLGRQLTMRFHGMQDADLFGAGSHGLGTLDSGVPNARADNAIAYTRTWGAVTGGFNYSVGRDASPSAGSTSAAATNCAGEAVDKAQCREWSAMLRYAPGGWGVATAYERQYGGTTAVAATSSTPAVPATFGGLTSPSKTDSRWTLNAFGRIGGSQVGIGLLARDNQGSATTPRSRLYWAAVRTPVPDTAFTVDAMAATLRFDDSPNGADLLNLRGSWLLMKDLQAYLTLAHIRNKGASALSASSGTPSAAPPAGRAQSSVITGVKYTF